jgi:hypothetical protein
MWYMRRNSRKFSLHFEVLLALILWLQMLKFSFYSQTIITVVNIGDRRLIGDRIR